MCVKFMKDDGKGGVVEMTNEEWIDSWHKPIMDALKAQFAEDALKKEESAKIEDVTRVCEPSEYGVSPIVEALPLLESYEQLCEYYKVPKYNIMRVE